jgi:hypothetical protein
VVPQWGEEVLEPMVTAAAAAAVEAEEAVEAVDEAEEAVEVAVRRHAGDDGGVDDDSEGVDESAREVEPSSDAESSDDDEDSTVNFSEHEDDYSPPAKRVRLATLDSVGRVRRTSSCARGGCLLVRSWGN